MRRDSDRYSRRGGVVLPWTPAAFGANLKVWVRGDDAGRSLNTGTNPYQIASYPDRGSVGGVMQQATAADQPLLSTVGGRTASYADDACVLQSDQAATNFKFLHDGTGCTIMALVEVTGVIGTAIATCTSAGTGIYAQSTASTVTVDVRNAGASAVAASASASLGLHVVTFTMSSGSYSLQVDDGTPSTGTPGTLSSADPTTALLQYAQTAAKGSPFTGALPEFFAVNRVLTAPEIAQAKAYLTKQWLQPWSVDSSLPWPQLWLDASDTASLVITSGAVEEWWNKSGPAIRANQATAGYRPAYGTDANGAYVQSDGSDDWLDLTGYHQASGKRTIVAVCEPNIVAALDSGLFDFQSGRFLVDPYFYATTSMRHYDGAWQASSGASSGHQVAVWQLDAATSDHRVDGSIIGSPSYADKGMAGTAALFSRFGGIAPFWPGKLRELLSFQPALSDAQVATFEAYLQAKWGTP